jgi:glycosyltransferase involved in cell wall biosynthesis
MIGPGAGKNSSGGIVAVISNIMKHHDKNLIIKHIVTMRPSSAIMHICTYLHSLLSLLINLLNSDTKIAHVHMSYRTSFYRKSSIILLLKLFRIPIIIHLHSGEFDIFFKELNSIMQRYVKWIYSLADKTILLTNGWHAWYKNEINANESLVVYNGVENYCNKNSPPLKERKNIILFLGRLEEKKGIYDLLYAFKKIAHTVPDTKLKICGDGETAKCKKLVEDLQLDLQVDFLGWVDENEKYKLLNKSKIYILPSYFEGLPMGVLEAMSAGIAVIATDVGGTSEAIEDKKNGLLIKAGSREQIYKNIIFLLQNPDETERLGKEARKCFLKNFDISKVSKKIAEVYYETLKNRESKK